MTPIIKIIVGAMLIRFIFLYTIKLNLWFGNISITVITINIIIKMKIYLFFYVYENNSFSLVQLTQIMYINHFISDYLLFIYKDRRRGAL